jgi:hypothetical protein
LGCALWAGGLITREDVDANAEEARGGGGMALAARNPSPPAFVREVGTGAPRDALMRGDDGRLCVELDAAEVGERKAD